MVLATLKRLLGKKDESLIKIHKPNKDNGKIILPVSGNTVMIQPSYPIKKEQYGSISAMGAIHDIVERKDPVIEGGSLFYLRRKTTKGWVEDATPLTFKPDTTPSISEDF